MSHHLVEDLDQRPPDMTVEEWNDIYIEVTRELHESIAKQLVLDSKQCEQTDIDNQERFSQQETDIQAELGDPQNYTSSVCAVCKNGVARKFNNRLACENPGCVDLIIPPVCGQFNQSVIPMFKVETLMIHLGALVRDHDSQCSNKLG